MRGIMIDCARLKLGNYRLVRMVGHGGFADVYLGEHVYLKTAVAIKVLHDYEDNIMLSDFGIAIALRNFQNMQKPTVLSVGTMIAGTTTYMAPEQFSGTPYYASDQYALAAVVYEWFCGTPPFSGSDFQVAIKHMYRQPLSMKEIMHNLAPSIDRVVLKALEKNPEQRFATIQHFASALEVACQSVPSRPYPVTKPLGPAPLSARNVSLALRNQWISAIGVVHERTAQLLSDRYLPFSKTLSANVPTEQRTLMSFRQRLAASPIQTQSIVLQSQAMAAPVPTLRKQPETRQPMSEQKKMWLLALAIFCLSSLITLSLIPFIQQNFQTPQKTLPTIATSVPQKQNTSIVPMSHTTVKHPS